MIDTPVPILAENIRTDIDLVTQINERTDRQTNWGDVPFLDHETNLQPVQRMLEKAFPDGPHEMLDLMSDGTGDGLEIFVQNGKITVVGNGYGIDWLKRIFELSSGILNLVSLKIHEVVRGDGKGIRILMGTYEVAKRLGMKRMQLQAVNMGPYVWSRVGFLPFRADWDQVRETADVRLKVRNELQNLDPAIRSKAQNIVDTTDPKAIWELADLEHEIAGDKLSKHLLLRNPWDGSFTVGDPEQEARLKEYAKSRGITV